MVTCRSVFLCRTTNAVSDEWCVLKNNDFLYSHFVSFYFFVIFVTSPEICVGKCCGMVCGNKKTYAMASDLNRCCHVWCLMQQNELRQEQKAWESENKH